MLLLDNMLSMCRYTEQRRRCTVPDDWQNAYYFPDMATRYVHWVRNYTYRYSYQSFQPAVDYNASSHGGEPALQKVLQYSHYSKYLANAN